MEPPSPSWLHGFATPVWYHLVQHSLMKQKHHPYGSTINCTQSYGATEPSMAPLVRNPGQVSFGIQIIHNNKHYPCASTIKCTQCHPTIKPFVVPCALYAQRVVRIVLNCTQTKKACTILCLGSRAGVIRFVFRSDRCLNDSGEHTVTDPQKGAAPSATAPFFGLW